jgi:hypothetical protein
MSTAKDDGLPLECSMKRVGLLLFILSMPSNCIPQITSNVFTRVLHLRVNAGTTHEEEATGFTIGVDGREYLITAKHVVARLGDAGTVGIEQNSHWVNVPVKIFRCDDPVDIAVLIAPFRITLNLPLPVETVNFEYGQEEFFLGFPYNMGSPGTINGGFPFALVKKGLISRYVPIDEGKKVGLMLLDGYNNPGFLGGPVVYRDFSKPDYTLNAVAVVSGFKPEVVSVFEQHVISSPEQASDMAKDQPWRIQKKEDGTYFEYKDTGSSVALNTGIVYAYALAPAIDLIRKHPAGPEEKSLTAVPTLK